MALGLVNKKVSVDFDFNGVTLRIQGADYFYGDESIRQNIGADITDENDFGGRLIVDKKILYQRVLVQLVAVLKRDSVVTNAAQSSETRYYKFYCHPNSVGEAFDDLPGKAIDENLLPGSWEVQKVMVAKHACYD
jgi:hypothetical protein